MQKKRSTIKDVARLSGLSLSTVSLVINKRGYVSPKTREKVNKIVEELPTILTAQLKAWLPKRAETSASSSPTTISPKQNRFTRKSSSGRNSRPVTTTITSC